MINYHEKRLKEMKKEVVALGDTDEVANAGKIKQLNRDIRDTENLILELKEG